jgi:hypothetical protein
MRKIIAALQTSVDSFIEGPNGEMDWAMAEDEETWRELDETLNSVDTFILGTYAKETLKNKKKCNKQSQIGMMIRNPITIIMIITKSISLFVYFLHSG